jgi:hypothetical protein
MEFKKKTLDKYLALLQTSKRTLQLNQPFEVEARLNIISMSPYLKENTALHHYKNQLVNAV